MTEMNDVLGFLDYCASERRLSRHTIDAYRADIKDFRTWLPVEITVSSVSLVDLKAYLTDMVSRRNLSPATVRRRLACLRLFFRWHALSADRHDPFANWRLQLPRARRLPRALRRAEITDLLSSVGGAPAQDATAAMLLHVAVNVMIATGLRVGELCRLTVEDVSPDGGVIQVRGKGARDRIVYITDSKLNALLQSLLVARRRQVGDTATLFVNRRGRAMRPQTLRARLRTGARLAGVNRRVTPHMLRHTAATLLIESGVDIRFVQRLLGHASIATTEIYTHVADESLKATLARADVLGSLAAA